MGGGGVPLATVARWIIHDRALRSGQCLRRRERCPLDSPGAAVDPIAREDLDSMASGEEEGSSDPSVSGGTRSPWCALLGRVRCDSVASGRSTRFCQIRE